MIAQHFIMFPQANKGSRKDAACTGTNKLQDRLRSCSNVGVSGILTLRRVDTRREPSLSEMNVMQIKVSSFQSDRKESSPSDRTSQSSLSSFDDYSDSITEEITKRKGILKVDHTNRVQNNSKKHVGFETHTLIQACIVEPLLQYKADLWWTKDELRQGKKQRTESLKASQATKALVKEYLAGVQSGRKEIQQLQQLQQQEQEQQRQYRQQMLYQQCQEQREENRGKNGGEFLTHRVKITLSEHHYQRLVRGRSNGFAGLEAVCTDKVTGDRILTTSMIVQKYRERRITSCTGTTFLDDDDGNTNFLRSYSQSLTATDRTWAFIIGRADMDACKLLRSTISFFK